MDNPPTSALTLEPPRSQSKMRRDIFVLTANLMVERPWLQQSARSRALADLMEMAENQDEQKLILELLGRFHFIDQDKAEKNFSAIRDQVITEWALAPQDTIILGSSDKNFSKSSDAMLYFLKPKFSGIQGWTQNLFLTNLRAATEVNKKTFNIVMVDDFIGTGNDISRKINWLLGELSQKGKIAKIYVCVLAAMEQSKSVLETLCTSYFVNTWLSRGISDFYQAADLAQSIQMMKNLEDKLSPRIGNKKLKCYSFGYKQSEALYHYENGNSPNNVFPLFWWEYQKPKLKRNPLFPRL